MRKLLAAIFGLLTIVVLYGIGLSVPIGTHTGYRPSVDLIYYNTYTFDTLPTPGSISALSNDPGSTGATITCRDCAATSPASQGGVQDPPTRCLWNFTAQVWSCVNQAGGSDVIVNSFPGVDFCDKFNHAALVAQGNPLTGVGATNLRGIPGIYPISTTCTWPKLISFGQAYGMGSIAIHLEGVVLQPTGIVEALQLFGGSLVSSTDIWSPKIEVMDTTLQYGIHVGFGYNMSIYRPTVTSLVASPNPTFTALYIGDQIFGDDTTFSQSVRVYDPLIMGFKSGGGGVGYFHIGVAIRGQSANISVVRGQVISCDDLFVLTNDTLSSSGFMPNKILFDNIDAEGSNNAAIVVSDSVVVSQFWSGYWFVHMTYEQNNTVLDLSGAPLATAQEGDIVLGPSVQLADNNQLIKNPRGLKVTMMDGGNLGPASYAGRTLAWGTTLDSFTSQQGSFGSVEFHQNSTPFLLQALPQCTVSGGETCTTQRCYRAAPVDWLGRVGLPGSQSCANNGPNTLNGTNFMNAVVRASGTGEVAPAGWRIYGRANGSALFMDPGTKQVNGVDVTMLNTDSGALRVPTGIGDHNGTGVSYQDTGTETPAGAIPVTNATGQVIFDHQILAQNGGELSSVGGSAPTVTGCGASANVTVGSTNVRGSFTTGTGGPLGCTLVFATAPQINMTGPPDCLFMDTNSPAITVGDVPTNAPTSQDVLTMSTAATSHKFRYHCIWTN